MTENKDNNKKEIYDKLLSIVASQLNISKDLIKPETTLEKLGADSLDRVEIVMKIEDEFKIEISDQDADKINNLEQAVEYVYSKLSK